VEKFMEEFVLHSDVKVGLCKFSGTIAIQLFLLLDCFGWESREETKKDMDYTANDK
jgi:hypothetical protein